MVKKRKNRKRRNAKLDSSRQRRFIYIYILKNNYNGKRKVGEENKRINVKKLFASIFLCYPYAIPYAVLFVLSMISSAMQKLLYLIRSHLFSFVFVSITIGDGSKKILL